MWKLQGMLRIWLSSKLRVTLESLSLPYQEEEEEEKPIELKKNPKKYQDPWVIFLHHVAR